MNRLTSPPPHRRLNLPPPGDPAGGTAPRASRKKAQWPHPTARVVLDTNALPHRLVPANSAAPAPPAPAGFRPGYDGNNPGDALTVTVEQARSALTELIDRAARGEKVIITRDDKPVAELVAVPHDRPVPKPGFARGVLTIVADDEEHLADFKDYMP